MLRIAGLDILLAVWTTGAIVTSVTVMQVPRFSGLPLLGSGLVPLVLVVWALVISTRPARIRPEAEDTPLDDFEERKAATLGRLHEMLSAQTEGPNDLS